jgi:hypothetical protein
MTEEKAIDLLDNLIGMVEDNQNSDYDTALKMGIKALEQEPILGKIRAQFKSHLRGVEITLEVLVENDPLRPKFEGAKETLEECLEIIDKAETEEK